MNLSSQETQVSAAGEKIFCWIWCRGHMTAKPRWDFEVCGSSEHGILSGGLLLNCCVLQPYGSKPLQHSDSRASACFASGDPRNRHGLWNLGAGCTSARSPSSSADLTVEFNAPRGQVCIELLCHYLYHAALVNRSAFQLPPSHW